MRLRNDEVGIDARWATLPAGHRVQRRGRGVVRAAVQARSQVSGRPYRPMAHPSDAGLGERGCTSEATSASASDVLGNREGTVIVCEIVLARGSLFGERLRVVSSSPGGAEPSDTSTVIYTDVSTGEVVTEAELFTDAGALWPAYIDTCAVTRAASACRRSRRPPTHSSRSSATPCSAVI